MSITMTTPSGTVTTMSPKLLVTHPPLQRKISNHHLTYLVNNWAWSQSEILRVHPWNPVVISNLTKREIAKLDFDYSDKFHVSNGNHRLEATKILFGPDFKFNDDHKARGLIPVGSEVGSPVLLTCQLSSGDPVDDFIGLNADLRVRSAEKFLIKMVRGDKDENSLYELFTKKYRIAVTFETGCISERKNTTFACHNLILIWKSNQERIVSLLDIITTTYKDKGVIDPAALKDSFMQGLNKTLANCERLHYDEKTVKEALAAAKKKQWTANVISRFCQATGSRTIAGKVRSLMMTIIEHYIKTGETLGEEDVDAVTLITKR